MAASEEPIMSPGGIQETKLQEMPIFQLLRAFKLQQYARVRTFKMQLFQKLIEKGYGEDVYKLALLNPKQRDDLVTQLKVLPGHKAKLAGLFCVIDEIYPKQIVASQLKQYTPKTESKKVNATHHGRFGVRRRQGSAQKSLLQQYEHLDPITKQAFNESFLQNMEKHQAELNQLMQTFVNKEDNSKALSNVFPAQMYGYGAILETDDDYNKEISFLLKHYSALGNYSEYQCKETLEDTSGYGRAKTLQSEMKQAMSDIQKINKDMESRASQRSKHSHHPDDIVKVEEAKRSTLKQDFEVFTDDQDKSRITNLDVTTTDYADKEAEERDEVIDIHIDPTKNYVSQPPQANEDISLLNPLQVDDSALNETKEYPKQNVFKEEQESALMDLQKPMTPLLDKDERLKALNIGQSLDSKKVTSALGYIDTKQICYCLAMALSKHIEFSKGYFFLEDLQHMQREKVAFAYDMEGVEIDIEAAKEKKRQKEEEQKIEFEALKQKMAKQESTAFSTAPNKEERKQTKGEVEEEIDYEDDCDFEIEDNYPAEHSENAGSDMDDMDFNYSQTQLEQFLSSQNLRGSNIQSNSLISTFLSSFNKMKSLRGSQVAGGAESTNGARQSQAKALPEQIAEIQSESSTVKGDDDEDEFGRSGEHIDLKKVDVHSKNSSPVKGENKPILSPDEVRKIEQEMASKQNIDVDMTTKEGFRDVLRFQMRIFDQNYEFERDELIGGESMYMGDPSIDELYYYCKYVIISGRMEKEIPILCLIYIERFLTKTGLLMNFANWKRLTLITLILASKIWDDDSLENVHFPQVMPDITLKEITGLEKVFLSMTDFDLVIRGSEYAKYYFILKTFSSKFQGALPIDPMTADKMSMLQNNTLKAESELREKHKGKLKLQ